MVRKRKTPHPQPRIREFCANCDKDFDPRHADRTLIGVHEDARVCVDCGLELAREYETPKNARLAQYGLTPEEHAALFVAQRGRCAICGERDTRMSMAIDHDHETGDVRGLLCSNCNRGLGCFKDDPIRLAKAMIYLAEPPNTRARARVLDVFSRDVVDK